MYAILVFAPFSPLAQCGKSSTSGRCNQEGKILSSRSFLFKWWFLPERDRLWPLLILSFEIHVAEILFQENTAKKSWVPSSIHL